MNWKVCAALIGVAVFFRLAIMDFGFNGDNQDCTPPREPRTRMARADRPQGRLPAFYSRIARYEQKYRIYDIQERYNKEIELLKRQAAELTAERDAVVERVLTEEQRGIVRQYQAIAIRIRDEKRRLEDLIAEDSPAHSNKE